MGNKSVQRSPSGHYHGDDLTSEQEAMNSLLREPELVTMWMETDPFMVHSALTGYLVTPRRGAFYFDLRPRPDPSAAVREPWCPIWSHVIDRHLPVLPWCLAQLIGEYAGDPASGRPDTFSPSDESNHYSVVPLRQVVVHWSNPYGRERHRVLAVYPFRQDENHHDQSIAALWLAAYRSKCNPSSVHKQELYKLCLLHNIHH